MVTGTTPADVISNDLNENSDISGSGQISIDSVTIVCGEGTATVYVTYSLTGVTHFLFFVFGSSSLERDIVEMLGFTDALVVFVGAEEAELMLSDIATVYGDGIYWLPAHTFQTMIPTVEVVTPQQTFTYSNITELSGMVYYASYASEESL
ncbi:MAG: hypothetical protein LBV40_05015 [Methanomicrobiales archaeon]|jgi:hypothetical protein|nr:hypothetical protein [Methanomicrobiales archaeon]